MKAVQLALLQELAEEDFLELVTTVGLHTGRVVLSDSEPWGVVRYYRDLSDGVRL